MRRIALVPLLLLLAATASAEGFKDAKVDFEKSFRPNVKFQARLDAVGAVAYFDSRDAVKVLLTGIPKVQAIIDPMVVRKVEIDEELEKLLGGQMFDQERRLPTGAHARVRVLKRESAQLQEDIDGEIQVLGALGDGLAGMRDSETIAYLNETALLREKHWKSRQMVAEALGEIGDPSSVRFLVRALKEKNDKVLTSVALALGRLKAEEAVEGLVKLLGDKTWTVRASAIEALGEIGQPDAVRALVKQIEKEDGRLRDDCGRALSKLTGQKFGDSVKLWKKWWEEHKGEYGGEEGKQLGGHRPDDGGDPGRGYYGIPITTQRAIFILDVSGSMSGSAKDAGREPEAGELSKIEAAKGELVRAVDGFSSKGRFNMVVFNDIVKKWKEGMIPASRPNKEAAKAWVKDLSAASSTNIYDALQTAFQIAGMGVSDKHYALAADTIFLLSDGSPTKPDGQPDDWMKIIRACREWNRLKRVKIHAIGVGGHNAAFMSMLAQENGGKYVVR